MADTFFEWLLKPGSLTTFILFLIFGFLFVIFFIAQVRGKLDFMDLICRGKTPMVSLSKILQLVGGIVSTWVVIKSTILSEGRISWEIFTAYLAYVGSVEAYGKYITLKNGGYNQNDYPGGYNRGGYSQPGYNQGGYNQNTPQGGSALRRRQTVEQPNIPVGNVQDDLSDIPDRVGGAKAIE